LIAAPRAHLELNEVEQVGVVHDVALVQEHGDARHADLLKANLEKRPTAAQKPRTSPAKGAQTVVPLRKPAAKAKRAPPSTTKTLVPASRTRMKK